MTEITDKEEIARGFRTAYQARRCTYNALSDCKHVGLVAVRDMALMWGSFLDTGRAVLFNTCLGTYVLVYSMSTESVRIESLTPDFEH